MLDSNPAVSDAALAAHARGALAAFHAALASPLGATLDAFTARRGLDFDRAPLENFTRTAQPVVHLPVWTARALVASGVTLPRGALEGAVDAALFGYLCAQVQDDGLEGRLGAPSGWALLAHAAFARHHAALVAAAGPSPAFWTGYAERWLGYADAVATFAAKDGPVRGTERVTATARSRPLVLPAAALLAGAGRAQWLEPLEQLVRGSTAAAQLYDDLLDAAEDLQHGRMTSVVREMGGEHGVDTLRRRLYLEGGFDSVLDQALTALASARDAANDLGMSDAAAAFATDAETMAGARRRYLDALEKHIFADARGPAER